MQQEPLTYEQELERDLKAAQQRAEEGVAASNFSKSAEGKLIQDWINERVSYLVAQMTGKNPLNDREYLSNHGAIRELQNFNVMLQTKARGTKTAQQEVTVLNEQRTAISGEVAGQKPITFS